jgi:hypothetical protein
VLGHLLIVLGAPRLLGDLLARAIATEPDVRLVIEPGVPADGRAAALQALADEPTATVVVLARDGLEGVVWRLTCSRLAPVSADGLLAAARGVTP